MNPTHPRPRSSWTAILFLAGVLLLPLGAIAQDSDPKEEDAVLDEIVVTAQKRQENVQEIPLSVTAFTAGEIEEAGIETPEDFIALVPNVFMANSFTVGNSFVTVRGITQINNADPPVAVVIDGVYLSNQKQFVQELFDIERIELLKGPQGALYGRNSVGGAINIITKQPGNDLSGFVRGTAGNGSSFGLAAGIGGALVQDTLFARIAASTKDSDGWTTNTFLNEEVDFYDDTTARLQLKWLPSDRAYFDLRASTSETDGGAVWYSLFPTTGFANDFREPDSSFLGFSERELNDYSLRMTFDLNGAQLHSITSISEVDELYRGDLDFSNPTRTDVFFPLGQLAQGQDLTVESISQELRITSADDADVRWIAGAYWIDTDRQLASTIFLDFTGTVDGLFPIVNLSEDNDNTAQAFFGQLDFDFGDRWSMSVGARYDEDERNQIDLIGGAERSTTFDAWQPRLTVQRRLGDGGNDTMLYLNLGTGFRSGGYNAPTVNPGIFRQEETQNVELGFKSTLWGGKARLNGAVYSTQVDDFQFFLVDIATASQIISNINEVDITGLELDFLIRPTTGVDLFAGLGFNDSEIQDFDGSGSFTSNQAPGNIRSKINLGAQIAKPISTAWLASARLDLEIRGKQYWHPDNLDVQDPVELINLRIGLDSDHWSIAAWAKNLTDEAYYVEYADALWAGVLSGDDLAQLGRPRTYGLELRARF